MERLVLIISPGTRFIVRATRFRTGHRLRLLSLATLFFAVHSVFAPAASAVGLQDQASFAGQTVDEHAPENPYGKIVGDLDPSARPDHRRPEWSARLVQRTQLGEAQDC